MGFRVQAIYEVQRRGQVVLEEVKIASPIEVTKALVELAEAMRIEGIKKLDYAGPNWDLDGWRYRNLVGEKRQSFEDQLQRFVKNLVDA